MSRDIRGEFEQWFKRNSCISDGFKGALHRDTDKEYSDPAVRLMWIMWSHQHCKVETAMRLVRAFVEIDSKPSDQQDLAKLIGVAHYHLAKWPGLDDRSNQRGVINI